MLGIAITTYNRREMVLAQIEKLRQFTSCEFDLVVCDDGSSDGTVEAVKAVGVKIISGVNRGIAWNKNRGLFYLREICGSKTILLLDDDIVPIASGWEQEWIDGVKRYGHVNWQAPGQPIIGGLHIAANPGVSYVLAGPCIAFSRQALSYVGYMDTRFQRYGHEHTDLSVRAIRAGLGGFMVTEEDNQRPCFYIISGGLVILEAPSNVDFESVELNEKILIQSGNEPIYRNAWRTTGEYELLRSEMTGLDGLEGLNPQESYLLEFDAEKYLSANPDVASSSFTALHHYRVFGIKENRPLSL